MIHCYYFEFKDKTEQIQTEHNLYDSGSSPFIDAGKVSDLSLEDFEKTLQK